MFPPGFGLVPVIEAARPARPDDLDVLAMLAGLARTEAVTKRGGILLVGYELPHEPLSGRSPDFSDPDTLVVVGTIDDVVMGYAIARVEVLRSGDRLGIVDELFVEPGARGVGVGELMMDLVVDFARREQCIGIDAQALPGDRATKNFFETFGLVARSIVVHKALGPVAP